MYTTKENTPGFVSAWSNWFTFEGTRSRASYYLALTAISAVTGGIGAFAGLADPMFEVFIIIITIPLVLTVGAQRFKDMGKSGWWSLITIIPLATLWPAIARGKGTCESTKGQVYWLRGWIALPIVIVALFFLATLGRM